MKLKTLRRIIAGTAVVAAFAAFLKLSEPSIIAALGLNETNPRTDSADIENYGDAVYWNERAEEYLHEGPISKAFNCYEKAEALAPEDSTIHLNFGNALFLYRTDAMTYYHFNEQQVFDAAIAQFQKAVRFDPDNFELAADVATSFYSVRPFRYQAALEAWKRTEALAETDFERQGIYLHLARVELNAGNVKSAQGYLDKVTDKHYADVLELMRQRAVRLNTPSEN